LENSEEEVMAKSVTIEILAIWMDDAARKLGLRKKLREIVAKAMKEAQDTYQVPEDDLDVLPNKPEDEKVLKYIARFAEQLDVCEREKREGGWTE
jgi:hypothetical protein